MQKIMSPIIPGLIDDLGRECLIKMPYQDFPTASSICKTWRDEITGQDFRRFRKAAGVSRLMIIMAQAKIEDPKLLTSSQDILKHYLNPNPTRLTYQLTISDPETRNWTRLPMIPGMPNGLPMFCGLVGSGSDILVIGGWDPVTWRATSSVYIYSFLYGKWRKGVDIPGVRRSFFGCTMSSYINTVLVAGGHDEDKNALKSALLYDVEKDKWTPLPDMERPRDECKAIFHRGMFHVISGYPTDTQGSFERTAEVFDPDTWKWGPVIEDYLLEDNPSPNTCVALPDGKVYTVVGPQSGDVAVRENDRWQVIAKLPADVANSNWMCAYEENKILVIGSLKVGEEHSGYMLDLNSNKWSKVDVPKEFSGHVQCGCVLEL